MALGAKDWVIIMFLIVIVALGITVGVLAKKLKALSSSTPASTTSSIPAIPAIPAVPAVVATTTSS